MDMSKLPRLSKTEGPAPADDAAAPPAASPASSAPMEYESRIPREPVDPGVGAQVWLSAIFGFVCLLVGRAFGAYWLARLTGRPHHTQVFWQAGPKAGTEVAYPELEGFVFWSDGGIFVFGVALLLEALVLATIYTRLPFKRAILVTALLVAVLATALNLFISVKMLMANGLPLWPLMAVAYGGFIVTYEFRLLRAT